MATTTHRHPAVRVLPVVTALGLLLAAALAGRAGANEVLQPPMAGAGSIAGAVQFVDGGPAEGVVVDLFTRAEDGSRNAWLGAATTNAAGSYTFESLVGDYVLTFIAPEGDEFLNRSQWFQLPVTVAGNERVVGVDATLRGDVSDDAAFGGTITDGNGAPVPGVVVDLFLARADGTRGAFLGDTPSAVDGSYSFSVTAGCYIVVAIAPANRTFDTGSRWAQLAACVDAAGEVNDVDAELVPLPDPDPDPDPDPVPEPDPVPDPGGPPPVNVTYRGRAGFHSFADGVIVHDAWTSGPIAFYAPVGGVRQEVVERWMSWYVRADQLYRQMSGRRDYDSVYRANDPNFGRVKALAVLDSPTNTCGTINAAGCGNKQQAQAARSYLSLMTADPNNFAHHWILFYEMGRGGPDEPFHARGIWPHNAWHSGFPHVMAGLAFHAIGGDAGIDRDLPGRLLDALDRWERANLEYVQVFSQGQVSSQGYISHDLIAAMFYRMLQETDPDTIERIFRNLEAKPAYSSATRAMCDFQDAVNDATNGRFAARLQGEWGMPDRC